MSKVARPARVSGITRTEVAVLFAIGVVLVIAAIAFLPRLRARRTGPTLASVDMQALSMAIVEYSEDMGGFPRAPFAVVGEPTGALADDVLYEAIANPNAGGKGRGWSGARNNWLFLRGGSVRAYTVDGIRKHQILDPWGSPWYYIAHPDYVAGVRVHDEDDAVPGGRPNYYGTTPKVDDYRGAHTPGPDDDDTWSPPGEYEPQQREAGIFYNDKTSQVHSKGPDRRTDTDACNRGTEADDVNNFGGPEPLK